MGLFYTRDYAGQTTDAAFTRTVGHEYEYDSGANMAQLLIDRGQAPSSDGAYSSGPLHGYGCGCPAADDYPVHPTSDGTAPGGEYLIGGNFGVVFGSPQYYQATRALSDAALAIRPGVGPRVGGHTHVGSRDLTDSDKWRLVRNYCALQDELAVLMAGSLDEARRNSYSQPHLPLADYLNRCPSFWTADIEVVRRNLQYLPDRPTLNFGPSTGSTVEFRGWNSTRAQWRMVLAANVSCAMVEAAKTGRDAAPGTDLVRHLAGLLKYDVIALIQRQRKKMGVTEVAV